MNAEEELAVFDLLTRPQIKLNRQEREQIKKIAKDLIHTLRAEKLVLDWRKHQSTRAGVRLAIEEQLDLLPSIYNQELFREKIEAIYQHVYDSYQGRDINVYN